MNKVHSSENWSDIFTKVLGRAQFEKLRNEMMGWARVRGHKFEHLKVDASKPQPIVDLYNPFEEKSPLHAAAALAHVSNVNKCKAPNLSHKENKISAKKRKLIELLERNKQKLLKRRHK